MFYKLEGENLMSSPMVEGQGYILCEAGQESNEYTYPVYGWYWFNTEEEAKAFFNL